MKEVRRYMGVGSTVAGLVCYALSSSFNRLYGDWNSFKICAYIVSSSIICLAILFPKAWQHLSIFEHRAHMTFLVMTSTTVYSFYLDRKMNTKPDAYAAISSAAFATTSLCMTKQVECGFVDLLYFFCGLLIAQLMKITPLLGFVGIGFSYFLVILRSYLDDAPPNRSQSRPPQVVIHVASLLQSRSSSHVRPPQEEEGNIHIQNQVAITPVFSLLNRRPHLEEFSLQVLLEATNNFSEDRRIGIGSFGSVYHATLQDGKEVAIKRAEVSPNSPSISILGATKRQEDKDNAFANDLENLSRPHHKNLVRLIGFYWDMNERILVYEHMNNGSLNDHLHELQSSALMSWPERIKVALDAARGIEYLHQYATPPIIHGDIKSSNILLDAKWTAKVADFGLSLVGPEDEQSHRSLRAVGTVGYVDPEYYGLQLLTTKSDVYSFGVVLLEMLSGHKAIHKNENGVPRHVVDLVLPYILQDEIHMVLDPRVPPPTPFEIEAVVNVGYLAADCLHLEGRDRPAMTKVANSLERALGACLAQPQLSRSTTSSSE